MYDKNITANGLSIESDASIIKEGTIEHWTEDLWAVGAIVLTHDRKGIVACTIRLKHRIKKREIQFALDLAIMKHAGRMSL